LPHCYVRKRSFLGPEFTKIALAARLHLDRLGELTSLLRPPKLYESREGRRWDHGNERERERERERDRGKIKGCTGSNEVCVLYCENALLATI